MDYFISHMNTKQLVSPSHSLSELTNPLIGIPSGNANTSLTRSLPLLTSSVDQCVKPRHSLLLSFPAHPLARIGNSLKTPTLYVLTAWISCSPLLSLSTQGNKLLVPIHFITYPLCSRTDSSTPARSHYRDVQFVQG